MLSWGGGCQTKPRRKIPTSFGDSYMQKVTKIVTFVATHVSIFGDSENLAERSRIREKTSNPGFLGKSVGLALKKKNILGLLKIDSLNMNSKLSIDPPPK